MKWSQLKIKGLAPSAGADSTSTAIYNHAVNKLLIS